VGVVLGPEGRQGGRVDLAAGRNRLGQALKVPLEAGGGVHLHEPRHGGVAWLAKVWAIPWGSRAKLPAGAVSCRCSTVNTTVPSTT
jgi:hypothetical protein